jgi:chromosome segregation ATPase
MGSSFVWIVMFAGAAVAWLGVLLITSERELKVRRREIEVLLSKLENVPHLGATPGADAEVSSLFGQNQELQNQVNVLTADLEHSRNAIATLRAARDLDATGSADNQRLAAMNEQLARELQELRSSIAEREPETPSSAQHLSAAAEASLQNEISGLRQALDDSNSRMRALEAAHDAERQALRQRIYDLEPRAAREQESLAELQNMRERLNQAETVQNTLRANLNKHEAEIPRWQARVMAAEENRRRLADLQARFTELAERHAAVAQEERHFQQTSRHLHRCWNCPLKTQYPMASQRNLPKPAARARPQAQSTMRNRSPIRPSRGSRGASAY